MKTLLERVRKCAIEVDAAFLAGMSHAIPGRIKEWIGNFNAAVSGNQDAEEMKILLSEAVSNRARWSKLATQSLEARHNDIRALRDQLAGLQTLEKAYYGDKSDVGRFICRRG